MVREASGKGKRLNPESTTDIIFLVIGGLGLFLFGMRVMSDALRRVAGDRLRSLLRWLTKNTLVAVAVGAVVTFIIQSSSATTVMVVGFVNAGLMTLAQAIGVVMGANIGTTLTGWLVSGIGLLKITNYALPAIGVGFIVSMLGKRKVKHWGSVLLGFGLLFFGLALMKDAFDPLRENQQVRTWIATMASNPLFGVAIGTAMTMVIQSSSATIAIAQMMALNGVLTFPQALPLILGDNIGTTITAQIASVGTNINAKRAARAHMLFNLFGAALVLPFIWVTGADGMPLYGKLVDAIVPNAANDSQWIMAHIAASHSIFNLVNAAIFIPLAGLLAAGAKRLVPGEAGIVRVEPQYLEKHLLETPSIALEQARREVVRMIELAHSAVVNASDAFFATDPKELETVRQKEDAVDNLQNKITQYLISVSRQELEQQESQELPVLLHSVNDIERIGDHAVNLMEAAERRIEGNLPFSDAAIEELSMMRREVETMFQAVIQALQERDLEAARNAFHSEEKLNAMEKNFRESHLSRLSTGECHFYSGLTFVDAVYSYEKIGDHLTNAAQAVLGDFQWGEKVRGANAQQADTSVMAAATTDPDEP